MNRISVKGGKQLFGVVNNQISKNATLPILAASLMLNNSITIMDYPKISDLNNMLKILEGYGVCVKQESGRIYINSTNATLKAIGKTLNKTMRSSIFLLGPSLARFKQASITMPGGCNIGDRPIDVHLAAFKKLGVSISSVGERIFFNSNLAHSGKVRLKIPSVGATENIIMFASSLKGKTTIINPAREPEIVDLCNFLNKSGARILGAGSRKITIYGVNRFNNTEYMPSYDRIVAGTIMIAVAICGGDVTIKNACYTELSSLIEILKKVGCDVNTYGEDVRITRLNKLGSTGDVTTGFYPEFPTDLQPMMLVLMNVSRGKSVMTENVFERRLYLAKVLKALGAVIKIINNRKVEITGPKSLKCGKMVAKDLRGGAAMVIAGLAGEGESIIKSIKHIERGYEDIVKLFASIGAQIAKI